MDDNYLKMSDDEKTRHLHKAGCYHKIPLLGWRPGVGPRCRLCDTVAQTEGIDDDDDS